MDFLLLSSLGLAMDATAHTKQSRPLKDLPVFKTLDEPSPRKIDPRSWKPRLSAERKSRIAERKQLNPPPLAAYSAVSELPFYSRAGPYRSHFNEFEMQLELHERQLERIRSIGWDSIRPIGIDFTLKEQQELAELETKHVEEEQQTHSGTHLQGQVRMDPFSENAGPPTPRLQPPVANLPLSPPPPEMDIDLDQDVQEDETSYDYGDEFARIDGEEDQGSENELSGVVHLNAERPERPERTVQQFIETSHIENLNHPYDVETTYNGYDFGDSESNNELQQNMQHAPSLLPPMLNQGINMTPSMSGATPLRNPTTSLRRSERRVTFDPSDCE
ncbi:LAFA_0F22100g1_1 [Lachancea sp. 'fantastica']|nr:LAFA_0F22100g1_1 [Lachancea sp. 'fantastica']